jgi:hypothetical protein
VAQAPPRAIPSGVTERCSARCACLRAQSGLAQTQLAGSFAQLRPAAGKRLPQASREQYLGRRPVLVGADAGERARRRTRAPIEARPLK